MSFDIVETDREIISMINQGIANQFNRLITERATRIQGELQKEIPKWILAQPEAISLSQDGQPGSLNAQFGLPPGTAASAILDIANAVAGSVSMKISPLSQKLEGKIELFAQPSDFRNLLSLSSGTVITSKGTPLRWLEWLLIEGDKIIITGYKYNPEGKGRSGGGTMEAGGSFRVRPDYAGTEDDNFITRSFKGREKEIANIFKRFL